MWTERGRPAAGYFTKRTAEAWLRDVLDQAGRGTLPGMVRTGVTFSAAATEYLRHLEHDRERKPSTLRDYRSIIAAHLLPEFGDRAVEDLTAEGIEAWSARLPIANRTRVEILTILNGVLERARRQHRLPRNPMTDVDKPGHRRKVAGLSVFTVDEVMALSRAAESSQDAAIFLVAAFTGLRRGELVALRWRDVDFAQRRIRVTASYTGELSTPKSGSARSVPMSRPVAETLVQVQAWMGHADIQTTMAYQHYAARDDEADLLDKAFDPAPADLSAGARRSAQRSTR